MLKLFVARLLRKLKKAVAVSGVTGKGKPARNLGLRLPGPCPHLACGVFFEIDSSNRVFPPPSLRGQVLDVLGNAVRILPSG